MNPSEQIALESGCIGLGDVSGPKPNPSRSRETRPRNSHPPHPRCEDCEDCDCDCEERCSNCDCEHEEDQ